MLIEAATEPDFPVLLGIWESAVRATHHFLPEASLQDIKSQLIPAYFPQVQLFLVRRKADGQILGFAGIAGQKLEMLFVAPEHHGLGVGKALLNFVVDQHFINAVDVNEQNPQAAGFYLSQGFVQVDRSVLDGQGNPFPILHLQYSSAVSGRKN